MRISMKNSDEQEFLRAYRRGLLGLALAWRTSLLVRLELPETVDLIVTAVIMLYAWGLAPYLALAGLAARIGHRRLLLTCSVLLLGGDILSGIGVFRHGSSTDAVALFTYPLIATFGLIPITWFMGWLLNR